MDASSRPAWWASLMKRPLLLGLLLYFVLLSIQYGIKAAGGDGTNSAIMRWREQLLKFQDGEDIFDTTVYPNPPIMALILSPIATWTDHVGPPPWVAGLGWFYLKVLMTLLTLHWVFRLVESPTRPFTQAAKVLTVLLSLRAITGDLQHGNVNLFILFLVAGALSAFQKRRDFLAGLLVALATSCKVTPALFVPYLVWKRAWKSLVGVCAGVALFFWPGVVPAMFLGWEQNLKCVESWTAHMVKPFVVDGMVTSEHNNQSLPGLVYRLLTDSPSFVEYPDGKTWTPARYDNIISLSPLAARWLVKLCMGLFGLFILWSCRTPRSESGEANPRLAAEYSLIILGMLLFSERTWKHHCVTLLLPFAVLSYHLSLWWDRWAMRGVILAALGATVLLMSTTSISLLGRDFGKLAQVYGAYVGAFIVLAGALTVVLRQSRNVATLARTNARSLAA
jgi:hypothetical protein